ncbi:unnamed protein product, partial [marine sediment metagenome]
TTKKVDLKKVRIRKKRKKAVKKAKVEEAIETSVVAVEATEEPAAVTKPKAKSKIKAKAKTKAKAKAKTKAKPKPKPIVPAGPMLKKPKPAELTGPQVVRVEKIEPDELLPPRRKPPGPARPARPPKPRYDEPISEPLMMTGPEIPGLIKGKKGAKEKTRGRRKDQDLVSEEDKRARLFSRRMRSRDLEERQARLAAARGESLRSRPARRIETRQPTEVAQVERP